MTSQLFNMKFLLIATLLLSMLLPVVQADIAPTQGNDLHHEMTDCPEQYMTLADHQHSSDCAEQCQCAATGCHSNVALASFKQAALTQLTLQKLPLFAEQLSSLFPDKFERPPRS
jgi:hypothetical protein